MHTTETTYSTITEDEQESFEKWLQQRDIAYLHSIKLSLIKTHPIIQVMYKRLVPSVVTETNFWNHYFFHMEKAGYDFYHQSEISSPQISSDVVEQHKEVNEEKKEDISTQELEAVKEGWSDVDLADIDKDTTPEDFAALDEAIKEFDGDLPSNGSINEDDWGEWEYCYLFKQT